MFAADCGIWAKGRSEASQAYDTRPRVVTSKVPRVAKLDQGVLQTLAQSCTGHKKGQGYRDPPHVKELLRVARVGRRAQDWGLGRKREPSGDRLRRAAAGDWEAYKGVAKKRKKGWEYHFAEHCEVTHTLRFMTIYKGSIEGVELGIRA